MSAPEDVWKSPETRSEPASGAPLAGGGLQVSDDPTDVPKAVWEDFRTHPVPYILANLGYMGLATVFTLVLIAVLGVALGPGIVLEDETMLVIGMVVGFGVYMLGILGLAFVLVPLWTASTLRGIDRQRRGEGTLGIASCVNDMGQRAGSVVGTYALTQALVLVGILFLYVPGIVAAAIGSFALPIAVFEDVGPVEAWRRAFHHAKNHASWHIGVFALLFGAIILLEFSLVGLLFLWPVMCAWQLYAYRLAWGEGGSTPVES